MGASLYQKLDAASHEAFSLEKKLSVFRARIELLEAAARVVCEYDFSDCDEDVIEAIERLRLITDKGSDEILRSPINK